MILTNSNPGSSWVNAMGPEGVRFPPGSWRTGGGGYSGYGYMIDAPALPRWRYPTPGMGYMIQAPNLPRYTVPYDGYGQEACIPVGNGTFRCPDGTIIGTPTVAPPAPGATGAKILLGVSILAVGLFVVMR